MAKLFDYDPITKRKQLFHWDETEQAAYLETLTDVTDIVETNKGLSNLFDERSRWKGDLHQVASIPMDIYMKLPPEIRNDEKAFRRWLNNADQKVWRTRPGEV